jgi:hypothetical protein
MLAKISRICMSAMQRKEDRHTGKTGSKHGLGF